MRIDDRLDAAGQRLRSHADQIEVPPPPTVRSNHRGAALAVAVAAVVTALLVIYAPAGPDVDDVVSPDVSAPLATSTTEPPDREDPSESTGRFEPASLVDGAILLPEDLQPRDAVGSDDGLMVVRAIRRPQPPGTQPQRDGILMAIDRQDGGVVWMTELSDGGTVLDVTDDRVFVAHYWTGGVTAFDLNSGDVLWTAVPETPFDFGDGPDRRLFIPNDLEAGFGSLWMSTARGAVARIDPMDGSIIDVFGLESGGSPISVSDLTVSKGPVWVAGGRAGLFRIDPGNGAVDRVLPSDLGQSANSVLTVGTDVLVGGEVLGGASGIVSLVDGQQLVPIAATEFEGFATVVETNDHPAVWTGGVLSPIELENLDVSDPFDTYFDDDRWLAPSDGSWIVSKNERLLIPVSRETTATPRPADAGPLFGVGIYTDAVLLFDDGLDGILAVEPDERLAARSTLEGQRAGDEPYSMIRVGDSLVVGWSEIFSVDIDTREPTSIGLATIFVPAAESDRVWMIDWPGGAIGLGTPSVWQVATTGEPLTEPVTLDIDGFPSHGVAGGLAVETDEEIVLWDANTEETRPLSLDSAGGQVLDALGDDLIWCRAACTELVVTDVESMESEGFAAPDGFTFTINAAFQSGQHLSPDGRFVAALARRIDGDETMLWLLDRTSENITTVSDDDTPVDFVTWGSDWTQVFASSYSYGRAETTVWRYDLQTGQFASVTLPFGGALTPVAIDDTHADIYITGEPGQNTRCERITDLMSSGDSDCWFTF